MVTEPRDHPEPDVGFAGDEFCDLGLTFPLSDKGVSTLAVNCPSWQAES